MFPPKNTWDQLPGRYAEWLRRYEAQLPRIQAQLDALPGLAAGDIEQIRYLLHGTAA